MKSGIRMILSRTNALKRQQKMLYNTASNPLFKVKDAFM